MVFLFSGAAAFTQPSVAHRGLALMTPGVCSKRHSWADSPPGPSNRIQGIEAASLPAQTIAQEYFGPAHHLQLVHPPSDAMPHVFDTKVLHGPACLAQRGDHTFGLVRPHPDVLPTLHD